MAMLVNFNPQALAFSSPKLSIRRSFDRSLPAIRRAKAMESSSSSSIARSSFSSSSSSSVAGFDGSKVDTLRDVSILAVSTGEPVFFRDLWDQNEEWMWSHLRGISDVLCCWELACVLKDSNPQFDAAGVKLFAVGVGAPDKAHLLAERLPFPFDCLSADPDCKAEVFSRFEFVKKAMKNYTSAATLDDKSSVLQQGGMLVFEGKQLLHARKDEGTGDHAPLDDILDICCKVPVA